MLTVLCMTWCELIQKLTSSLMPNGGWRHLYSTLWIGMRASSSLTFNGLGIQCMLALWIDQTLLAYYPVLGHAPSMLKLQGGAF